MKFREFFQDDIKKDMAQATGGIAKNFGNPNDPNKLIQSLRDQGLIVLDPKNNEGLNYLASLYHYYFPDSGLNIDDEPSLNFGPTQPPPLPQS